MPIDYLFQYRPHLKKGVHIPLPPMRQLLPYAHFIIRIVQIQELLPNELENIQP